MTTTDIYTFFNLLHERAARAGVRPYRTPKSKHVFTQYELLTLLVFKHLCKGCSYRDLSFFAPMVLKKHIHFTTPHKAARRFGTRTLVRVMRACLPAVRGKIVAIDGTGFCMQGASMHYVERCYGTFRANMLATLLIDTSTQGVLAAQLHVTRRHEIRDARVLIQHARDATHLVADRAYDDKKLHMQLARLDILPHIPARKTSKRGYFRKKHLQQFDRAIYGQRSLVETVNSVVKRRFGSQVTARKCVMRRIEILLKLIAHNAMLSMRAAALIYDIYRANQPIPF